MRIIGIDSSTPVTAVALLEDDKLLAEVVLNTQKKHSQRLMPMIDMVLKEAGMSPKDLDAIAVSSGPGSFTGVRIGVVTVKALSWVLAKPLVAVPTLDALAFNVQQAEGLICPILNARKNEIYTALYTINNENLSRMSEYSAVTPEELIRILQKQEGQITLLGDAVDEFGDIFKEKLKKRLVVLKAIDRLPRAAQVAYLGWKKVQAGDVVEPMQLKPLYIRPSEAEKKLAEKEGMD